MTDEPKIREGYLQTATPPKGDAEVIADTARQAALSEIVEPEQVQAFTVPPGGDVRLIDGEQYADQPRRKRGTDKTATVESFIELVKSQQVEGDTTVWVHPTSGQIRGVLNDHGDQPRWRDHRVELGLIHTDEWAHWLGRDSRLGTQVEFAEHIEDGLTEIVAPPAADLLEIAQSFHATTNAAFRSAHRLADGSVQVKYDEKVEAAAGRNQELEIPTDFVLSLPPFVGEDPYKVTARLRYRVGGGSLHIGYKLDRPGDVVRDCLDQIAERLRGEFTRVYQGEPS